MSAGFRNVLLITHRWLGLSSAIVLVLAGVTGVLLAWPWPGEDALWRFVAGRLHESLALGILGYEFVGYWAVTAATAIGVTLLAGGLVLWWKRRIVTVRAGRGWWLAAFDAHHAIGVFGAGFMLLIAATGLCVAFLRPDDGVLFEVTFALHTTRGYSWPIKLLYMLGSLAFATQVAAGVVTWWKPALRESPQPVARNRSSATSTTTAP